MYNSAKQFLVIEIDIVHSALGMTEIGKMNSAVKPVFQFSISCRIATDSIQRIVDGSQSSVSHTFTFASRNSVQNVLISIFHFLSL